MLQPKSMELNTKFGKVWVFLLEGSFEVENAYILFSGQIGVINQVVIDILEKNWLKHLQSYIIENPQTIPHKKFVKSGFSHFGARLNVKKLMFSSLDKHIPLFRSQQTFIKKIGISIDNFAHVFLIYVSIMDL